MLKYFTTFLILIPIFIICNANAQISFSFELGGAVPNMKTFNDELATRGFQQLNGISTLGGIFVSSDLDDYSSFYVNTLFAAQINKEDEDNGINLNLATVSMGYGIRAINKYKSKLDGLFGVAWSPSARIQIRNQVPESGDLLDQLDNPTSTLIDLKYRSQFYLHTGVLYRFRLKTYYLGLKGGYYFRLSKPKWQAGNQDLASEININPLGAYLSLIVSYK